jgi:hypothetical protein
VFLLSTADCSRKYLVVQADDVVPRHIRRRCRSAAISPFRVVVVCAAAAAAAAAIPDEVVRRPRRPAAQIPRRKSLPPAIADRS